MKAYCCGEFIGRGAKCLDEDAAPVKIPEENAFIYHLSNHATADRDDGDGGEIRSRLAAPEQRSLNEIIFLPPPPVYWIRLLARLEFGRNTTAECEQQQFIIAQAKFRHLCCATRIDVGKFRP